MVTLLRNIFDSKDAVEIEYILSIYFVIHVFNWFHYNE